jgi:hypothetical protein
MWTKRIKDIAAMLLIGDGALTLIGARKRALVWRFGPKGLRESTSWQADHPCLMRTEGAASIALVALLAAVPRVSSILGLGGGRPDGGTKGIER